MSGFQINYLKILKKFAIFSSAFSNSLKEKKPCFSNDWKIILKNQTCYSLKEAKTAFVNVIFCVLVSKCFQMFCRQDFKNAALMFFSTRDGTWFMTCSYCTQAIKTMKSTGCWFDQIVVNNGWTSSAASDRCQRRGRTKASNILINKTKSRCRPQRSPAESFVDEYIWLCTHTHTHSDVDRHTHTRAGYCVW